MTLLGCPRSRCVRYDLNSAIEQLSLATGHLEGIASALAPEHLVAGGPKRAEANTELACDAQALISDVEAAIAAREPRETIVALVNSIARLTVQLRDQVLDEVVSSESLPDHLLE